MGTFKSFTLAVTSDEDETLETCTAQLRETDAAATLYGPLLEKKKYDNVFFPEVDTGGEFRTFDGWTAKLDPGKYYLLNLECTSDGKDSDPQFKYSETPNVPPIVSSLGYVPLLEGQYDQNATTFVDAAAEQSKFPTALALEVDPVVGSVVTGANGENKSPSISVDSAGEEGTSRATADTGKTRTSGEKGTFSSVATDNLPVAKTAPIRAASQKSATKASGDPGSEDSGSLADALDSLQATATTFDEEKLGTLQKFVQNVNATVQMAKG